MPHFDTTVHMTGDVDARGATNFHPRAGSITNPALAVAPIKLYTVHFDLAIGATPVAREEIVCTARADGTINFFYAGLNVTGSTSDMDFDLNVNGTTALSAVVNVDNADADRANVAGTLSTTTLAAGDVISVSLEDIVSSTGAQGPFAVVGITWNATLL